MSMAENQDKLETWLETTGHSYGFDVFGLTTAELPGEIASRLDDFVSAGFHGEMDWLAKTRDRRISPTAMWEAASTAIIFGCNYGPDHNPLATLAQKQTANISVYARGRDYHDVLKGRLKQIASQLHSKTGWGVKIFVDTAPLMEKPLAAKAGIGWQGKHTNLVSRDYGSWLFLGIILTDGELASHLPIEDSCGSCTACLDICPTQAFPAPYKLDARKCISYLTIEYDGHIPLEYRRAMGNRVFGCDDCLAVCPWNKFASAATDIKLIAGDNDLPRLATLLEYDQGAFRRYFSASPVKRTGYIRFTRNLLIAAGNAKDLELVPKIKPYLSHEDARLRAMAIWAISQYLPRPALRALYNDDETDAAVKAEWQQALLADEKDV